MTPVEHTKSVTLHMPGTTSIEDLRKFVEDAEALISEYQGTTTYKPRVYADNSIEYCDGEDCNARYEQFTGLKISVTIPKPETN